MTNLILILGLAGFAAACYCLYREGKRQGHERGYQRGKMEGYAEGHHDADKFWTGTEDLVERVRRDIREEIG